MEQGKVDSIQVLEKLKLTIGNLNSDIAVGAVVIENLSNENERLKEEIAQLKIELTNQNGVDTPS